MAERVASSMFGPVRHEPLTNGLTEFRVSDSVSEPIYENDLRLRKVLGADIVGQSIILKEFISKLYDLADVQT
jgi:hypothetical protein